MKPLNDLVVTRWLPSPCARLFVSVSCVFSLSLVTPAVLAQKQISYPVAIPAQPAAAAPAPVVPSAPEPIIRPVDQASSVPPQVKKATVKNVKPAADDDAPAPRKTAAKKTSTPERAEAKKSVSKKEAAKKSEAAETNKKAVPTASSKTIAAKKAPPESPAPKSTSKPSAQASVVEKKTAENPEPEKIVASATPLVATASVLPVAAAVATADEEEVAQTDDEPAGNEVNLPSTPPAPATVAGAAGVAMSHAPLPMSAEREAFVNNFKDYVETKIVPQVPGLALAIISEGKVKFIQGYGIRKAGSREPVTPDTVFRLASLSKSFGATAAAMLVRDNLLNWDTPVTSVLPDVVFSNPRYGSQLTIENILSQSSGLPTQANTNFIEEGQSFDEVVSRLRNVSFICPPGKCYNYQNVTYSLIGPIIQKKTGKTYEKYVEDNIFAPLGMRSASFGTTGLRSTNNFALPHLGGRRGWAAAEVSENYYRFGPAAGINASITDMSRWMLAHMGHNPDVLQPSLLNKVHSKVTRNTPAQNHYGSREGVTDSHYGLGWRIFDYRGDKNFVHHGGGVLGFRSEMVYSPELQIGMVVLTNTQHLAGDIIFEFLDAYEDQKRGPRKIFKPAPAPVKKKKAK